MSKSVKNTNKKRRGTAVRAAVIRAYITQYAKNPLIGYADIAELLGVSRAYVQQVVKDTPGLADNREAARKKYFNHLLAEIKLPE